MTDTLTLKLVAFALFVGVIYYSHQAGSRAREEKKRRLELAIHELVESLEELSVR